MGKLAVISEETVQKIVTRQLAFDSVRDAFEAVGGSFVAPGWLGAQGIATDDPDYYPPTTTRS